MRSRGALAPWVYAQLVGVLLGLAFVVPWGAPLAWIAMWLILERLRNRSAWERAADGSLAGVWWAITAIGIWLDGAARTHLATSSLGALAITFTVVFVHGGVFLALFTTIHGWLPRPRWLAAPAVWVLLEQGRTYASGGAPWALLGHSQHGWLRLAQIAEIGGVEVLSFLIVLTATALAERGRTRRCGLVVAAACIVGSLVFGTIRSIEPAPTVDRVTVQLVSGEHPSSDRLVTYVQATKDVRPAALTVWPEGALREYLQDNRATFGALGRTAERAGPLLVGGVRREGAARDRRDYNSAFLVGRSNRLLGIYDKRRLVPFAERAPHGVPEMIPRPLTPGAADVGPMQVDSLRIGVLISWEGVFPALARAYARDGANVLVNLTSDDGLGLGARQQLWFSSFRAIETRRWLLRASGMGASVAIDPLGRWHGARVAVPIAPPRDTFYVKYGAVVPWLSIVVLTSLLVTARVRGIP